MILAYLTFFIIGLVVFFMNSKMPISIRLAIAIGVFVILSLLTTLWAIKVGDKPLPGAVTISPKAVTDGQELKEKDKQK